MPDSISPAIDRSIKRLPEKELVALFALMMSLTALSMDSMLPAFPYIAEALAIEDYQKTQWIVSALIFGMVFGEIVFGPLSDAIGRKKSILIGICIYIVGSLVALSASSLTEFLIGRMIQGFGVAGPKIASRALIRDMYKGAAMARIMSFVMMVFILVPLLAFDKKKNRVGYGKGYYDRYLSKYLKKNKNIITIGVAFSFQKYHKLPFSSFDVKLNYILTEKGLS